MSSTPPTSLLGGKNTAAPSTERDKTVVELLSRNPDADMATIRDLCRNWRLRGLDPLIEEATGEP